MIPGEIRAASGTISINAGKSTVQLIVTNMGDRPVQVGSHYHFYETNRGLRFDRALAFGRRLDIPAGTAVRFEPGEEKAVTLTELGGSRVSYGLNSLTKGEALPGQQTDELRRRLEAWEEEGG
ncbi:urease subunit beta [Paenibacillus sp. YYML68]|uniref:urease subunit beta n=1 Tax=Paenibacillus sp. YYML68 TaxID=2909250 RepID=UPI002493423F|nr:urease subunit beta [Paenibacillus sp. YYML68]